MTTITINPAVAAELDYIVELHKTHGAPNEQESVEALVQWVLQCVADGSRRPGAWERGVIEQMGLVAETDAHHAYRQDYGRPSPNNPQHWPPRNIR